MRQRRRSAALAGAAALALVASAIPAAADPPPWAPASAFRWRQVPSVTDTPRVYAPSPATITRPFVYAPPPPVVVHDPQPRLYVAPGYPAYPVYPIYPGSAGPIDQSSRNQAAGRLIGNAHGSVAGRPPDAR
jgi:hypothetical protein